MMRLDRRTFMTTMGAALLAMRRTIAASIPRVGMQLYTVRTELEKDFDATLAKVAAIGYKEVEFAGYYNHTPQEVRDTLKRHALAAPSAHVDYGSLTGDKWAKAIENAHTIGHTYLVNAWVDESIRKEPDAWKHIAETYNQAAAVSKKAGIQFAYHNHNFEFAPRKDAGGKLPYDILLESCDPALVKMELDLCWISAAGKDPLEYFRRYPGRFPLVHVKGLKKVPASTGDDPVPIDRVLPDITEVGHDDVIDWKRIFAQSRAAGIRHYFVEHDVPKDPFASLKASYEYVSQLQV
ncbi:MAG TPA: sugar phosphate isomerase/epimerase [Vicinamibacterales bacterium]|nr:sugar phosphate isomerase/epimerase [Vicinamibacterales bacterium]